MERLALLTTPTVTPTPRLARSAQIPLHDPYLLLVAHLETQLRVLWLNVHTTLFHIVYLGRESARMLWSSRASRRLQKKLFFELAVLVLGPGNALLTFVFWPGWLDVGGLAALVWVAGGWP